MPLRSIRAPTCLTNAEWFLMAGHIALPCKALVCSYAAPNVTSEAGKHVLFPRMADFPMHDRFHPNVRQQHSPSSVHQPLDNPSGKMGANSSGCCHAQANKSSIQPTDRNDRFHILHGTIDYHCSRTNGCPGSGIKEIVIFDIKNQSCIAR